MFRAIGTVIVLYAVTQMFAGAIQSFESASIAVFQTVETAANVSTEQLEQLTLR